MTAVASAAVAVLPVHAGVDASTPAAIAQCTRALLHRYPPLGAVAGAAAVLLPAGVMLLITTVVEAARERLRRSPRRPPRRRG